MILLVSIVNTVEGSFHDQGFIVTPRSSTVEVGERVGLRAQLDPYNCYQIGGCIGIQDVTGTALWTAADNSIVSHSGGGVFTALSEGTTSVTGSFSGKSSTVEINVIAAGEDEEDDESEDETASASGQVSFVKKLFEIPIELPYAGVHYQRKQDAIYVNGNFVMSGECGGGIGAERGGIPDSFFSGGERKPSEGGLWVFNESGSFVAEKNICDETGLINVGVHHHSIGQTKLWGNSSGFIAQTNFQELGSHNAIIYYTASGSNVMLQSRIKIDQEAPVGGIASIGDPALTDEVLVDFGEWQFDGGTRDSHGREVKTAEEGTSVRSLPSLAGVNFFQLSNNFRPGLALGEYIIGTENRIITDGESSKNNWIPYVVYRVNDGTLEFVQELKEVQDDARQAGDGNFSGFNLGVSSFDYATNPKRIAFWNPGLGTSNNSEHIFIYEHTSSGLRFVEKRQAPWDTDKGRSIGIGISIRTSNLQNTFAIAGDITAFATEDGKFEVWKDGQKIGEGQLPPTKSYFEMNNLNNTGYGGRKGTRTPHRLVISPAGNILAMNEFGAYLFKLGASPTSPPFTPQIPDFSNTNTYNLDINFFLKSAQSYVDSLVSIFGSPSQSTPNTTQFQSQTQTGYTSQSGYSYTLSRPPQTIAEIRQFQCAYDIVCGGTIETTGWGNLGPKTRAKIQEVFGN
jgi:hypothetical protein